MSTCLSVCLKEVATHVQDSIVRFLSNINWFNEIKLMVSAVLIASVILYLEFYIFRNYPHYFELRNWIELSNWTSNANVSPEATTSQARTEPTYSPGLDHYDPTRRTVINDLEVYIFAWPSKGGVIILDYAEAVDLEFLGLDPLNPPAKRYSSQTDEDAFCQRLLLLGAKWWDGEARWQLLKRANELDDEANQALEEGTEPAPTMRERRWVSVGWPTTGGLWVSEFDTNLVGIEEEENLVPFDTGRLRLTRTMEERCQVLREHFKGKFYGDVSEYKGHAFLNSWIEDETVHAEIIGR